MESYFGTLKTECLHHYRFATRKESRRAVFEYIEVFYASKEVSLGNNRIRRNAKLDNPLSADHAEQCNHSEIQSAAQSIDLPVH